MKLIKIITILLLLSSCDAEKRMAKRCAKCPSVTEVITKEVIKTTPFDTTLFISQMGKDLMFDFSGDCCSVMDSLFAEMGRSSGTITAVDNGVKSSIFKKGKKIVFRCEADSLRAVIKGLRTTIQTTNSKVTTKTITLPAPKCEKQHKDWLDKYDRPWFFISLGALLLFLFWKFKPTLLGLFKKLPL